MGIVKLTFQRARQNPFNKILPKSQEEDQRNEQGDQSRRHLDVVERHKAAFDLG